MPTTSPLKRPSAGGRLGRLLASLRPPSRSGSLPVQTGFPTSLADLVVKNHGRLKNPRRRHRPTAAAPPHPAPPPAEAVAPRSPVSPPKQEQRRDDVDMTVRNAAGRRKGAAFSIRPEVLAVGGAVALALLVVWSKWLVAAATVASVALFWIESVRSAASRRRPRPESTAELGLPGRGIVSPIREGTESEAGISPRSSCADSDSSADTIDLGGGGADDSIAPKRKEKEKRRSLRRLIANKLRNGKKTSKDKDSLHGGESEHSDAGEAGVSAGAVIKTEPAFPGPAVEDTMPPEAITGERCRQLEGEGGVKFPSSAFVPIILVGLVAGKLPAVALTVLCAVFFSSVDRVPSS